ncbi:Ppx/GppA phosphatase family protein [Frigoriflavimonas asaccharolytica]|uniref:Exopolyphosphatase/guanosine-5'-triphosphate, 3'-diphosphate pyrophosphatase n=1 Tax=Frigoriflavimonas asaccharolytica TaxID=2735899 RepID=A0A8J8G8J0_9FLAO|nr:exopolyphosphatase [Frigoriflavimonas asaccharolytica]NRS93296.1 exopolyphosphatase/guanosine-5'-triphosphate,3'-diphosphate pyrophosphatase [Frigoriflavimonas asaccharolytica]
MKIAAIDIGSNAARLLINEVLPKKNGEDYTKLNLLRIPLRLGMDVFTTGEIGETREKMMLDTMKIFSDLMKIYEVEHYRACATSAMRDAKNGQDIIKKIKENTGINIEIISGDEEASIIVENHIEDGLDKNFGYLYVDVGGGSTELMYYENEKLKYKKSFNIGTIRVMNDLVTKEMWKELETEVKNNILSKKPILGIGSGGNINKIASLSKTKDGKAIQFSTMNKFYKELSPLSIEERMEKYNLRRDRADVIVPALSIFNKILSSAKITKIFVPKISVADGLIHNIYDNLKNK